MGACAGRWEVFFPKGARDALFGVQCIAGQCGNDGRMCGQVGIPREQVHAIQEHLPVSEAATEYAGQLLRLDQNVLPRNSEGAAFAAYFARHVTKNLRRACQFPVIELQPCRKVIVESSRRELILTRLDDGSFKMS